MAEINHYYNSNTVHSTECGKKPDSTDLVLRSPQDVNCVDCLYCLVKKDGIKEMAERYEPTGGAYGTPDRAMTAPQKEDAAVAEHAQGCMTVVKEAEAARREFRNQRDAMLAQVAVWRAQIQVSEDAIARLNDFLGESNAVSPKRF